MSQSYDEQLEDTPQTGEPTEAAESTEVTGGPTEAAESTEVTGEPTGAAEPTEVTAEPTEVTAEPTEATADVENGLPGTDTADAAPGVDTEAAPDSETVPAADADASPAAEGAGEQAEEKPADPLEEFREALWAKPGDWFVVHTYSGMENWVKANLENRTTWLNIEDFIHEVTVPTEEVAEIIGIVHSVVL